MTSHETKLRLAFVGWGAIARATTQLLADMPVEIVAVAERNATIPPLDLPAGARLITDPSELEKTRADLVVEAASREAVPVWGRAALEAGMDLIVSSVSAFADPAVLDSLRDCAARTSSQLHIQPGAIGAIDALAAAAILELDFVIHRIIKPPHAWLDTPAEALCDLHDLSEPEAFFNGTAAQAASQFPKNANVAMTTALAGVGSADTQITLVADPHAKTNRHEIHAAGAFGELSVSLSSNALKENPKTSTMAALNLLRAINNLVRPVVI